MRKVARFALLLSGALLISACSGVNGPLNPNQPPDTRVTADPPALEQTTFTVEFFWTGSDPDGWVDHFEWRISDNGPDGIVDVEDTLGLAWHSTVSPDSVFVVSADLDSFPKDVDNPTVHETKDYRFWQTHTFFVRSVDEQGVPDDTPASVSFTATTIAPGITIDKPPKISTNECVSSARALSFGWSGVDPDDVVGDPAAVRYALVNVENIPVVGDSFLDPGTCLTTTKYEELNPVPRFKDEDWSDWIAYDAPEDSGRAVTFPLKDFGESFIFAVQAKDVAGAVTPTFEWGKNVRHVKVAPGKRPGLTVSEKFLGSKTFTGANSVTRFEIVAGQPLEFSWLASAEDYGGKIEAFRYGWEIQDVNDDDDPGWAVPWGDGANFHRAPIRTFQQGSPNFVVQVRDNSGTITRATYQFEVIQISPRAQQFDLLFIDDFALDPQGGGGPLTVEWRRIWQSMLEGHVTDFEPSVDYVDASTEGSRINFRLVNNYKSVIWFVNGASTKTVLTQQLQPSSASVLKYNWMEVYQSKVGNVLIVGPSASLGMVEAVQDQTFPLVYNTQALPVDGGLGCTQQPDHTCLPNGISRWPYSGWCLESSDFVRPNFPKREGEHAGTPSSKTTDSHCDFLFRAEVAPEFLANFPGANGIVEDLVVDASSPRIPVVPRNPSREYYKFNWEEFYNRNVAPQREVTLSPRNCQIPMFLHRAARDEVYPPDSEHAGEPIIANPDSTCIPLGLESSPIDGASVGVVSSVYSETKQLPGSNDFLWGFHPLAFRLDRVQAALLWIIGQNWDIRVTN